MKVFNAMFSKVNGGLEQVFLNYIPALTSQGAQVIPIIHPAAEIKKSCPTEHLITIHNFNQYDPFAIRRLRKLIQSETPDCIIMHSYRAAYLFEKTKTKVPKIAVCHVRGHYNFGADAIIAITEHMREEIIQSGQSADTVFTVPNMISLPANLCFREPRKTAIPVIGVCARFVEKKGVDVFIEALAELKRRKVIFKAKIAGDGREKENYTKLIHHHALQNTVELLGWINDKHAFYEELDIFCLPSREEAFGLVILEGMRHSLPMVLSALPGPLEVIGHSTCGVLASPGDPIGLADGLERLIKDNKLARQLAWNGFQRVQNYSSQHIGAQLHHVLEIVCNANASNRM